MQGSREDLLDWQDVLPRCFSSYRKSATREEIRVLFRHVREWSAPENLRLIECCYDLEEPEISLHDRGFVSWDSLEASLANWEFPWLRLLPDSYLAIAGTTGSVYLEVDPLNASYIIAIADWVRGKDELITEIYDEFGAEAFEPKQFEWRFLSHYDQQVGYGGDWKGYVARCERVH